ncbi:MAG: DUF1573 domain-containing protein [Bacteroidales bacterium]|jgi:hypothetical protein|nr:DUF1573 domain-containing protein [Bacteroidales bacterium]
MNRILTTLILALFIGPLAAQTAPKKATPQTEAPQKETVKKEVAKETPKKEVTATTITGAEISFEKNYFDFGNLKLGDVKESTLTFTNTGKKPLILDDVISSCDCTEVTWSKEPVMPGQKGTIKAKYTAKYEGMISKRVTVYSNADSYKKVLELQGNVTK